MSNGHYGFGVKPENELEYACNILDAELRKLGITRVELEYSEGTSVSGHKGSSSAAGLYGAVKKLREKTVL